VLRRTVATLVALALWALVSAPTAAVAQAPPRPPPPPPPKASIAVDADTGAVVYASGDRMPLRVASVIKLLTALIAIERLPADATVPVSAVAEGMPARKINMKAGQAWALTDTLYSLLLVSANDAAAALAERVSGSRAGFAATMAEAARDLGLEDSPVLRDPAGLDAEPFAFDGGNYISARDMAIVARAALVQPTIRLMMGTDTYRFHGGDGIGHVVRNHNLLLKQYPGATGMKTGYTRGAGHTLVASATRGGRTMIAVVLNAVDANASAAQLLDRGFNTPVAFEGALGHLPPPTSLAASGEPASPGRTPTVRVATARQVAPASSRRSPARDVLFILVGTLPALAIVARRRRREGKRPFFTWG
jgi:D-alanyl-D-alanine carboxypeptidase